MYCDSTINNLIILFLYVLRNFCILSIKTSNFYDLLYFLSPFVSSIRITESNQIVPTLNMTLKIGHYGNLVAYAASLRFLKHSFMNICLASSLNFFSEMCKWGLSKSIRLKNSLRISSYYFCIFPS